MCKFRLHVLRGGSQVSKLFGLSLSSMRSSSLSGVRCTPIICFSCYISGIDGSKFNVGHLFFWTSSRRRYKFLQQVRAMLWPLHNPRCRVQWCSRRWNGTSGSCKFTLIYPNLPVNLREFAVGKFAVNYIGKFGRCGGFGRFTG